jgi:hypothetical protein
MTVPNLEDSTTMGALGVLHLNRLWSRSIRDRAGILNGESAANDWALDNVIYHGLNLSIEETIQFLYREAPSLEEFENWVRQKNGGSIVADTIEKVNATIERLLLGVADRAEDPTETFLTSEQLDSWNEQGYLVVSGLFSETEVRAAEAAVWQHLGMDPDDPNTWYERKSDRGIMVQLFDHPALEAIRRSEKLKQIYAQIWRTSDLLISTDRVSFNPPERPGHEFPGPRLHWDVSLELPIPFNVQGLVYLTDTAADQGAFTCVPGFHTRIETWLDSLPSGADPRNQDIEALGAMPIPGIAGDLVIWHQALPHGSSPNRATRPRIVEYVTMFPADAQYAEKWK